MSTLSPKDVSHVFESLRKGLVPERGADAFAIGTENQRSELYRQLQFAAGGDGSIKFLRGGYGCGKTFMARLAILDAQRFKKGGGAADDNGFVTSFVVVSDNDLKFHRFDDVYRKVLTELSTTACPRGALGDILDRWIGRVEDKLVAAGADDSAKDFDQKVRKRLDEELAAMTGGRAPQDFVRVVQTIFDLKQKGEVAEAGSLISWLCGSGNVGQNAKRAAGIKGEIGSRDALDYLRGVLEIVKAAGYAGLVIVIDEAETILRMRSDSRHKSLNGIRQIADAAGSYPGLLWIFTGTPEFFDLRQGVAGLTPLHDRIRFIKQGKFASLRQAQLELTPFDDTRLKAVARRLRELYPMSDRSVLIAKISDEFIDRLVRDVTAGFKADVGVVPRQFLREFVTQLDYVDENPDYEPMRDYAFQVKELTIEEQHILSGGKPPLIADDATEDLVPSEDIW